LVNFEWQGLTFREVRGKLVQPEVESGMKTQIFSVLMACGSLVGSGLAVAQDAVSHAPDGGTSERIQSVTIPAIPNAPFRAVVTTEWTRIMPDGSTAVMKNHRTVARDSSGRIFQERRFFSPMGDKQVTRLSELDYEDPSQHQMTVCRPDLQVCTVYPYTAPRIAPQKAGPLPNGAGTVTEEPLGQKTIDSLEVVGSREVTTINVGAIGNEKPQPVVKEFWYSPRLEINVTTKRFDPRASAIQDFEVGNINTAEPDATLFQLPANYRVVVMEK
jgi:hypothetical protein